MSLANMPPAHLYAAILAGGVGTRLWPRSREARPKQFSDITGSGQTMIQQTVARLDGLVDPDRIYVVTGAPYADLARAQLPHLPPDNILAEPAGRNTAPAIGLACAFIHPRDPLAVVAFLHSDHAIPNVPAFQAALTLAAHAAVQGYLVTLGIQPTFAHTGYGYIKAGAEVSPQPSPVFGSLSGVYEVQRFLEKPDRTTAESFLAEGGYYWNAGMFITRVSHMLDEIHRRLPALGSAVDAIAHSFATSDAAAVRATMQQVWPSVPAVSIDHGIMESAQNVAVVPLDAGWNDIGSWDALELLLQADEWSNIIAHGDVITIDSRSNIVLAENRLVALVGVENLVVVDTGDTLLIGNKHEMQKVKELVERLRALGRSELL